MEFNITVMICYDTIPNYYMLRSVPEESKFQKIIDVIQPFLIGGLSGMLATSVIQPIDMIKTIIQIKSETIGIQKSNMQKANFTTVVKDIFSKEGIKGFYRGLDSALTRQIFYATTRLGAYKTLSEDLARKNAEKGQGLLTLLQKVYCSTIAGFVGSLLANPADLILIRMQADSQLPLAERRNYKNVFDAFKRIAKDDGVLGLWRGSTPTVVRAVVINIAMLASYDEAKQQVLAYLGTDKETVQVRVVASFISGTLSSVCGLPFDNAKTKLQKMKALPDGSFPYKSIFDAMFKTITREGFTRLWIGLSTFYFRLTPHIVITLLVQDWITDQVKRYRNKFNVS